MITRAVSISVATLIAMAATGSAYAEHYHHHWHDRYYYPNEEFVVPYPYYMPYDYSVITPHATVVKPHSNDLSPAQILGMKVQLELKSLGLYNGSVDGTVGPNTSAAIRAYQAIKGLEQTGAIDAPTLKSLGIKDSTASTD